MISGIMIAGALSAPAIADDACNPPKSHLQCGHSPVTYECPPCPPGGIHFAMPSELEDYRRSLESYRESIETKRADNPGGSLVGYDKAIDKYERGISTYKDAVTSIVRERE
jgi:hypothetical protein